MSLLGYDVSVHNETTPSLRGVSFLFARMAFGNSPDGRYLQHINAARAQGKIAGSYGFLMGPERNVTLANQVEVFARVCATELAALDLEHDVYQGHNYGRLSLAQFLTAVDLCRRKDVDPGCYADFELWTPAFVNTLKAHAIRFFWVPNYTGVDLRVTRPYIFEAGIPVIHQYAGSGVDRNRFYGTLADLQRLAGLGPPTGSVTLWPGGNGFPAARLAFRGLYRARPDHAAHVLSAPHDPDAGFITATIPAGHPLPFRVAQTVVRNRAPLWHGDAAGKRWVAHQWVTPQ